MHVVKLIESISVITASASAIFGVFTWRKETRWKRKYELAEEVLSNFYEAQQNIKNIRSPFGFAGEGEAYRNRADILHDDPAYDRLFVIRERYEKNKMAFEKLQVLKFRFIAVFGKKYEKPFHELISIMNEIFNAASRQGTILSQPREALTAEFHKDLLQGIEEIIYEKLGTEPDTIEKRVHATVSDMEQVCGKIIGKK